MVGSLPLARHQAAELASCRAVGPRGRLGQEPGPGGVGAPASPQTAVCASLSRALHSSRGSSAARRATPPPVRTRARSASARSAGYASLGQASKITVGHVPDLVDVATLTAGWVVIERVDDVGDAVAGRAKPDAVAGRAKPRANDYSHQATPSHMQPRSVQLDGTPGHTQRHPATRVTRLTSEGHWFDPSCAHPGQKHVSNL